MSEENTLISRWLQVYQQLAKATTTAGRDPASVKLLAVSKQHSAETIRALALAGQRDFGESYVQEAQRKQALLSDLPLCWHFIGQIQSNKTRAIAEHFDWVHTLDRHKHAERLNEQRPTHLPALQVCIQVMLAEESGKGGLWPEEVLALAQQIQQLPRLKLRGLMCIPPPLTDPNAQLAQFQRMQALLKQLNTHGLSLDTLSMGMSDDYVAAIAAGATIIRIGTAIFGQRNSQHEDQ